jgi:hypothetical protein
MCRIDLLFYNLYGRWSLRRRRRESVDNVPNTVGWHRMPELPQGILIPAMSIEHAIDRSGAFVVIVVSARVTVQSASS